MFFKKFFFLFVIFCLPSVSYANFFSNFTCVKDMKKYYPDLVKGNLEWQKQKRFFRCFHDILELFVDKGIFTHDSSRDHFTKTEIFRLFHLYFEYDVALSRRLTEQVFAVKKILVGGSADQLKDQEIADFYRLIYDYREIYFILHKQIPVFRKVFTGGSGGITPEQSRKALDQMRKSFVLLERAYTRENIVYPIGDLYKYHKYLKKSQLVEHADSETVRQSAWFLHNLFQGLFSPQKEIKGKKGWSMALRSLYEVINLFFYYKTYFLEDRSSPERTYRIIESVEMLIDSLQQTQTIGNQKGFPLKNLDEMLSVLFSFLESAVSVEPVANGFFANIHQGQSIPLLTRTLFCFSLESSAEKNCKSKWGMGPASPIVTLSFTDTQFEIFSDKIKRNPIANSSVFVDRGKWKILRQWLSNYKKSILRIHYGDVKTVAVSRQFDHWLSPFFGWENNSRIEFGSFHPPAGYEKFYQLLDYHALLPLLFASYLPEGFFSSEKEEGGESVSIPFSTWKRMVEDISPALAILAGKEAYQSSWRPALFDLFHVADSFLYSSNRDKLLNSMEFIDLTVHFLEGIKSAQLADSKISNGCADNLNSSCAAEKIIEDQEILAAYPRFQQYLFASQIDKYKDRITAVLGGRGKPIQAFSFLPLFILIQTMELNYELIDRNQSFNLESDELLLFANNFEELLADQIPYLLNKQQARSYLMYSFKMGDIPFFTGHSLTPLKFAHWHLDPKNRKPFSISPNEFHFLIFDFYKLYQKF